ATHDIRAVVTGDHSLRSRPMDRVMEPLSLFGATFDAFEGRRLPLSMHGAAEPIPVEYEVPVASAQIKSALLFAGLNTPGITTIIEREATRDHTEKMLKNFGAEIHVEVAESHRITIRGYAELSGREVFIPGDPSSAAFPGVAALIVPGSEVTIRNIGVNPRRAGLFETLRDMGASLEIANKRISSGEPVADITFRHGPLTGADIPASRAPSMIDEYPIAAVAAAFASGQTLFWGLGELRVKESDRFIAIINGLTSCGVPVRAEGDDILVEGLNGQLPGGAKISVNLDHRVAMAYLVLGLGSEKPVEIDDATAIGTSFPGFLKLMRGLGAKIDSVES
ncbi:MAG: 3-phosphoshikimate 1-carboxyvinyltransferase, partial [Pseudomonadota bacterium]|nr:3-phosphoshikimate 1-carboxyvinyltransferase [Pseudomonadota bacterium]